MSYRVLQKKQPSTGNHRDTLLTPAQLQCCDLKCRASSTEGDGGDMTSVVRYFMGWLFFFGRTRYHMINWHYDDDNNKYLTLGHNRNRNNKKNH